MAQHICGIYYSTFHPEAAAWDQWQRHYLPQVALKSHATILSRTSRTVLTQTFENPNKSKGIRNVRYTFPLYDGVSVVGFTCQVGNRLIKGKVKEKEKAKADYEEAVQKGQTAGLLEQLPDASDVFTTTIGNIPPGATIVSEITYLGELKHDAEVDGMRFTIPTAIAPRYGSYPGKLVQDAATSTAAQASSGMEISVDAVMDEGSFIKQLRSPSHPIAVSMGTTSTAPAADPTMTKASATLSLGTAELEKDFVLQVVTKDSGNPTALLEVHPYIPNQRALMATLVPKFSLPSIRPEIVFVCDRSGSMDHGGKIPTAITALKIFLKSLPVGVKFNICSFGGRHEFLWPRSQSYGKDTLDQAIKYVENFRADFGGTEIFKPLKATIEKRYKDMELEVMLLTDGDVWGHEQIFGYLNEQVHKKKAPIRLFTLGVGMDVSHALIEGVARAGNGFSQAVGDNEKMDSKIVRMLKGALTPHITDYSLEVKYADVADKDNADDDFEIIEKVSDSLRVDLTIGDEPAKKGKQEKISLFDTSVDLDAPEPQKKSDDGQDRYAHLPEFPPPAILQAPTSIPPLFPFNRSTVYLLLSPNSPAATRTPTSVILRGTSPQGPLELEIPIKLVEENGGKGDSIHQLAAHKAVLELEEGRGWMSEAKDSAGKKLKEKMEGRWDEMVEREAVRLGVQFQVGGKWCSFVAVEENEGSENTMDVDLEYMDEEQGQQESTGDGSLQDYHQSKPVLHQTRGRGGGGGLKGLGRGGAMRHRMAAAPMMAMQIQQQQQQQMLAAQRAGVQYKMFTAPPQPPPAASAAAFGVAPPPHAGPPAPLANNLAAVLSNMPPPKKRKMMAASQQQQQQQQQAPVAHVDANLLAQYQKEMSSASAMPLPDEEDLDEDMGFAVVDFSDEDPQQQQQKKTGSGGKLQTKLQSLVALQTFEGFWEWSAELLALVGVDEAEAKANGLVEGPLGATMLAIAFCRKRLADEEDAWELVVEKAEEWVQQSAGGEDVGEGMARAEALVEERA